MDIVIHTTHHADLWSSSDFYRNIDLHVWFVTRPVSLVHPMVQLDCSLLFIFWTTFTFTTLRGLFTAGRKQEKKKTEEKESEERNCRPPPHHTSQDLQITNPRHRNLSHGFCLHSAFCYPCFTWPSMANSRGHLTIDFQAVNGHWPSRSFPVSTSVHWCNWPAPHVWTPGHITDWPECHHLCQPYSPNNTQISR